MAIAVFELFSKRQKKLRGEVLDVYTYDTFPVPLRVQVIHILHDSIGSPDEYRELSVRYIDKVIRDKHGGTLADDSIRELNVRFREHGFGYEYIDGELLRDGPEYAGAQAEFLNAHEHYRHGRKKEALTECLKALESLMKGICTKRNWSFPPKATASVLLQILFDKGLIPTFWQQHFAALRSTLEAGVPTARNNLSGHGQGVAVIEIPEYLASYVLHLTASGMLFLADAEHALP